MVEEQPDRESRCPNCGGAPTDESVNRHSLSAMGYLHDDQHYKCSECAFSYVHGVPVGEPDVDAEDLWCDVCELGFMKVHRALHEKDGVTLHLKCGHHHEFECPECEEDVSADGVRQTKSNDFICPHCDEDLNREKIPYCHYWKTTQREADGAGRALIGYPSLTGNIEEADSNYGYPKDNPL